MLRQTNNMNIFQKLAITYHLGIISIKNNAPLNTPSPTNIHANIIFKPFELSMMKRISSIVVVPDVVTDVYAMSYSANKITAKAKERIVEK